MYHIHHHHHLYFSTSSYNIHVALFHRCFLISIQKCKAQKAWIALEVSNTPYILDEISLYGSNGKPPWFLNLNPAGTVPVLNIDNGNVVLPDSDLILDYIHDNGLSFTSSSSDDNDDMKEKIDSWREIVNTKLIPIGKKAVLGSGSSTQKLYDLLSDMDTRLQNEQKPNNDNNNNGKYLCGDQITVADCSLFPFLWRIDTEFGIEEYTTLNQWLDTCRNEDAFRKTIQQSWWWWW